MEDQAVVHEIGGQKIAEKDFTKEQLHHKNHVVSLRNKIAKLQFEMDDLLPSLKFHEDALLDATKKQAEESVNQESKDSGEK